MKLKAKLRVALLAAIMPAAPYATAQSTTVAAANPAILDQLAKLQAAVKALGDAVNGLDTKVTAIGATATNLENDADANVRYSPPAFVAYSGTIVCSIANVTDAAHAVSMEVISGDYGTVKTAFLSNYTLPARQATVASEEVNRGIWYCRYKVLDGTRADIRALATVFDTDGSMPPFVMSAH